MKNINPKSTQHTPMNALTIAGSDSGGGAGIQADLKTFAAMKVHGLSIITSLTAQNTLAVREVFDVPVEFIKAQFDAIHEDFDVKAAKTGMLSSREIIRTVVKNVRGYPLVVDPVMVAESGGKLLKDDAVLTIQKKLLKKAVLVTPNLFEAEILSGIEIKDIDDMKNAARIISSSGCSTIVKGGHLNATDVLYHEGEFHIFKARKIGGGAHGSGCTFASAITAGLSKEKDLLSSIKDAKRFISRGIKNAYSPGKGVRVVNQLKVR